MEQCCCVIIPERISLKPVLYFKKEKLCWANVVKELGCFSASMFSIASFVPGSQVREVEVIYECLSASKGVSRIYW